MLKLLLPWIVLLLLCLGGLVICAFMSTMPDSVGSFETSAPVAGSPHLLVAETTGFPVLVIWPISPNPGCEEGQWLLGFLFRTSPGWYAVNSDWNTALGPFAHKGEAAKALADYEYQRAKGIVDEVLEHRSQTKSALLRP